MSRTIEINPVTRIEGHGKVHLEIGDDNKVSGAYMHVLEFRGFEKFVQGMQVEQMPTLTTRICGTCPHAHHLVSAKTVDRVFSVTPPRTAVLLRELLNTGSIIHSHAIHFFALAGPDLLLGLGAPAGKRNLMGLLEIAPELAGQALRLRSLGQKIVEIVGGRGTHPVTAMAGGMACGINKEQRAVLQGMAKEALDLTLVALQEGKKALTKNKDVLSILPLAVHDVGTVAGTSLNLYDGILRVRRPDGTLALDFNAGDYQKHLFEEALPFSYGKQMFFRDPAGQPSAYRVGPLARLNCVDSISTPRANEELGLFKANCGAPCPYTVMGHYARLIEMVYCAELAVQILADDEILSDNIRAKVTASPKSAIAHIEAPRGVLIHDYDVDSNGLMRGANLIVATQQNLSCINATIKAAGNLFMDKPDDELLNSIEFSIRCYDPCLSCATHQLGQMPLEVNITRNGQTVRSVRR